ncbi:hypothetical protein BDY19DRAFT_935324 [Irpex rosettiformis]|uniref:Uncharacterized protein n=1 Tax=Irpex rosettiformis TaxID=378272 RepID=A0ACB8UBB7_9APHY|nr:hypothetical protein BDY19DRAFT_935324 [Irpex rosettiformis]
MAPFFSKLLPALASAYGLQTVMAAIFVPQAKELWYDLGGGLGFLSTTLLSLYYPSLKAKFWDNLPGALVPSITDFAPRQILLTALMTMWSARLGYFLVARAIRAGGDSRFDEVKHQPLAFSFFWFAQATWVFVVGLPVYMVNTMDSSAHPALGIRDYLAVSWFAASWFIELVADHQKSAWKKAKNDKEHDDQFISSGLWSISRHPNYVGEVGVWIGMWGLSTASLTSPYAPRFAWVLAGLSPLLTWFLLTKVSGIPPLEAGGDKKFAGPKWEHYKRTVPIFWPLGAKS